MKDLRENIFRVFGIVSAVVFFAMAASAQQVQRTVYDISDYKMGLALRRLRQPSDLVVVLAREVGSPVAIYYSGGRGWVFPPAGKEAWDRLPATDR